MTPEVITPLASAASAIIAALITAWVMRHRTNIAAVEGDRKRIHDLEGRVDTLEVDRENDRDYIGVLKGHIWGRQGPPPPPRPPRPGHMPQGGIA